MERFRCRLLQVEARLENQGLDGELHNRTEMLEQCAELLKGNSSSSVSKSGGNAWVYPSWYCSHRAGSRKPIVPSVDVQFLGCMGQYILSHQDVFLLARSTVLLTRF